MNQHASILKFFFIGFSIIILSIAIGNTSSDNPIISLALCSFPLLILITAFIKEKIWYTWFILPPVFLLLGDYSDYSYIVIFTFTTPLYVWYAFRKKIKLIWNSLPILDIPLILLFLYILYVFLSNPFGLSLDFFEDYYGGKGYIVCLGALIAYVFLSTINTSTAELKKLLLYSVGSLLLFTFITTCKDIILNSGNEISNSHISQIGESERETGLLMLSLLILNLLFIQYSIFDFIKKAYPLVLSILCSYGILISGFRSRVALAVATFLAVSILYRRWATIILIPIISILGLTIISTSGHLRELPYGIQRCLAPLEFLDIDPSIRQIADDSINWRTTMWEQAFDRRSMLIKDPVWGDGFCRDMAIMKGILYSKSYNIRDLADKYGSQNWAINGDWHNGPISTINVIGYIGFTLLSIICIIGGVYCWIVCEIYKHSSNKLGIIYITISTIISIPQFYIIGGHASKFIPSITISLTIVKLLFSHAKKEGLYIPKSTRKEYIPMICRQANSELAS